MKEIRAVREVYAQKFGGNIQAMLVDICSDNRKVVAKPGHVRQKGSRSQRLSGAEKREEKGWKCADVCV